MVQLNIKFSTTVILAVTMTISVAPVAHRDFIVRLRYSTVQLIFSLFFVEEHTAGINPELMPGVVGCNIEVRLLCFASVDTLLTSPF